jgi:tol-pal system protein YbgF
MMRLRLGVTTMKRTIYAAAAVFVIAVFPAAAHGLLQPGLLHPVQVRGLFGESDEEKAARLRAEQHERDQDAGIAEVRQRISDLEQALRLSTGQNEQLSNQIRQLTARLERQQRDFDYKLCTLVAQQMGTGAAADTSGANLPCDPNAAVSALANPGSGGTLGTLPVGPRPAAPGAAPAAPGGQAAAPAVASRTQYDGAMNLLARARYDEARAAFRAFADANPRDGLAPQAVFWIGNIAYTQRDYTAAAQAFAEQIKKWPNNPQGAEAMLKLGLSLIALGEKREGCVTLGAIRGKFRNAPANILTQAATARAQSSCPRD